MVGLRERPSRALKGKTPEVYKAVAIGRMRTLDICEVVAQQARAVLDKVAADQVISEHVKEGMARAAQDFSESIGEQVKVEIVEDMGIEINRSEIGNVSFYVSVPASHFERFYQFLAGNGVLVSECVGKNFPDRNGRVKFQVTVSLYNEVEELIAGGGGLPSSVVRDAR
jgi:hypothetical protein